MDIVSLAWAALMVVFTVSVLVWLIILSDQLLIIALVSYCLTN